MSALAMPPAPDAPAEHPDSSTVCPPNHDLVCPRALASMNDYLRQTHRWRAGRMSARADELIADTAQHQAVMMALGRAEEFAPDDERPAYIARTDAYAAHYGLRGWYRCTADRRSMDTGSTHRVQINLLRTPADGDRGRYFYYTPSPVAYPRQYAVIDRDTGTAVFRHTDKATIRRWITTAETGVDPVVSGTPVTVTDPAPS